MSGEPNLKEIQTMWHGNVRSYIIGFVGSFVLTSVSFYLVINRSFTNQILIYMIPALALLQAVIQLVYFLHLGKEEKPRWETGVFFFMLMILVIVVCGSLWVMNDLDQRMMMDMTHE